jgi:predicted CDP-diglyceride synthetase/phosphatidate cytidylyltransferase
MNGSFSKLEMSENMGMINFLILRNQLSNKNAIVAGTSAGETNISPNVQKKKLDQEMQLRGEK